VLDIHSIEKNIYGGHHIDNIKGGLEELTQTISFHMKATTR
jgi:hypothetical protein